MVDDSKRWVDANMHICEFFLSLEYLNQLSTCCLKALEHTEEFAASRGSFLLLFLD